MGIFKGIVLACFAATVLQGAMITSGTMIYRTVGPGSGTSSATTSNFQLSDGVLVTAFELAENPFTGPCRADVMPCKFSGFPYLSVGEGSSFTTITGIIGFSYSGSFLVDSSLPIQTAQLQFVAGGSVGEPNPDGTCVFPEGGPFSLCNVPVTGYGTATATITKALSVPEFYLTTVTYSFAPEPSTTLMMGGGILLLLTAASVHRRRRIRARNASAVAIPLY